MIIPPDGPKVGNPPDRVKRRIYATGTAKLTVTRSILDFAATVQDFCDNDAEAPNPWTRVHKQKGGYLYSELPAIESKYREERVRQLVEQTGKLLGAAIEATEIPMLSMRLVLVFERAASVDAFACRPSIPRPSRGLEHPPPKASKNPRPNRNATLFSGHVPQFYCWKALPGILPQ